MVLHENIGIFFFLPEIGKFTPDLHFVKLMGKQAPADTFLA